MQVLAKAKKKAFETLERPKISKAFFQTNTLKPAQLKGILWLRYKIDAVKKQL